MNREEEELKQGRLKWEAEQAEYAKEREEWDRIKASFVGQFDNYMAKNYYVDGLRGEAKKIGLPRNLVVLE